MISDKLKDTLVEEIIKGLIGQGPEGLPAVLEMLYNSAMKVERGAVFGSRVLQA